jgi:hypothetical protein
MKGLEKFGMLCRDNRIGAHHVVKINQIAMGIQE